MYKKLALLFACLCLAVTMSAQKRVTGHVAGPDGEPLSGASVRVTGTSTVTTTDANGNFTLVGVPNDAKTLSISHLGMQTQTVNVTSSVHIQLQENETNLDDAVVIGYGTAKRLGTVVGSVTKVSSENIENKPITTAMDAMQGKVPGVQILTSSGDAGDIDAVSTSIRGVGSLSASNEPLYVIDGTPSSASVFYMLNQNDIESTTVLRDVSSTSIYGSRASNGVFYVTTKRGSRGEKAVVRLSQSIGWSQLARSVGDPMNAGELLQYQLQNGIISGAEYATFKKQGYNTDWEDYFYRDSAPMYNTNFSIAGGSEKTTYYVSASYLKKEGLTARSHYKRYTLRSNLESQVKDWLKVGLNLGLNYDERSSDYLNAGSLYLTSGILGGLMLPPYYNPYNADGSRKQYIPFLNALNEYETQKYNPSIGNDARINGTAFVELTPLKGLTIRSQLGLDGADTRGDVKDLPSDPRNTAAGQGFLNKSFGRFSTWTITNTAEYKWNVDDNNNLTFLIGQEGIKYSYEYFNSYTQGQSDDRLMELGHGNEALIGSISSSHSKYEYLSFFGRVDYDLFKRYYANLTVRNDRSSRFGKNKRSAWFVSGGLMWDMKSEQFLKDVDWLNNLQVKASVGTTGNSGIGNYASLGVVGTTRYNNNTNGWILSQPANDDLTWEKQIQYNIGFNARFLDRINVELTYYMRKTKDMLMSVPVPYTTGFSSQMLNVGEMQNQGIEFAFDADAVKNWNGLTVNLYGNISYNANKITKLFYGLDEWIMQDYGLAYFVGKSVNYYMPVRAGINPDNGHVMWYVPDENGKLTKETTEEFDEAALSVDTGKKYFAPWTGGFGLRAAWKGLTLNADFSFVLGKYMQDNIQYFTKNSQQAASGYNQDRVMLNAWKKPGDITDVPVYGTGNYFDTSLLQNASFCRLKNLSLSYDLPRRWMDATGFISNVRLTAAARNLFTITKWKGSDPETDTNVASTQFPNTREFSLGVEVTF